MTNEDIRDCENCKHYVLHDKTVHLPPIYACEEWECKFEPKEGGGMTLEKIIQGLKVVRTIHNGNYTPQIDSAIHILQQIKPELEPCEEQKGEVMDFPPDIESFLKYYSFKDTDKVYTNGSQLIPLFRVRQAIEHYFISQPCEDCVSREEAIRVAEQGQIQGYEWQLKKLCNLPAVKPQQKWIPVSERLPEEMGTYMTTVDYKEHGLATGQRYYHGQGLWEDDCVIAWMPLPESYKEDSNE